ncbi:1,4-dihydroxy-6-naphthoate synthase [bacterium]|nr:1,4-dihydroxy-6-naphthoate synthase [bacterium]
MQKLSLGFSPCPNDTYIFDALIHGRIRHDFEFDLHIEDVETLNQLALNHQLDITKISIHAWFHVLDRYRLLSSGGALGRGCGPMIISKGRSKIESGRIALPGELTTASLLFKMAFPGDFDLVQMPFEKIIPAIMDEEVDAGVIIHESRFTYRQSGLHCLLDLGKWWEDKTDCLIPLGGIIISDRIDVNVQYKIQELIRKSIQFVEKEPELANDFIQWNAQELDRQVIESHIGLYVNEFSKDLGPEGRRAVTTLYNRSCCLGLLPEACLGKEDQLFVS